MSYQVFTPFLQLREFDDSGLLLANGTMEFYRAGTSDWGNIYADSIGTPAPNPVQLDGAGTARDVLTVRGQLEQLRYGRKETWPEANPVFRDARRACRRKRK